MAFGFWLLMAFGFFCFCFFVGSWWLLCWLLVASVGFWLLWLLASLASAAVVLELTKLCSSQWPGLRMPCAAVSVQPTELCCSQLPGCAAISFLVNQGFIVLFIFFFVYFLSFVPSFLPSFLAAFLPFLSFPFLSFPFLSFPFLPSFLQLSQKIYPTHKKGKGIWKRT